MILSLAVIGLLGSVAFADDEESFSAGPGSKMSEDAATVARMLLSPQAQIKECLAKIESSNLDVVWGDVTVQLLKKNVTRYVISGMALQGGDIAIGTATVAIEDTEVDFGFGKRSAYMCTVTLPKAR